LSDILGSLTVYPTYGTYSESASFALTVVKFIFDANYEAK